MIELLRWLLEIVAEWPKNAKDMATRRYFEWRKGYEVGKNDRLNRAHIVESVVREESKLQGS